MSTSRRRGSEEACQPIFSKKPCSVQVQVTELRCCSSRYLARDGGGSPVGATRPGLAPLGPLNLLQKHGHYPVIDTIFLYLELPGDGDVLVPDLLRPVVPLLDLLLQLRVVS